MNQQPLQSNLTLALLAVLRAMARSDMSTGSSLTQVSGISVLTALPVLIAQGYAEEHVARQRDGRPTSLFSLTAAGEAALKATGVAPSASPAGAVAPARTQGPSTEISQGNELRPYAGRAGSMDAFRHPSRVGGHLHHPDGSVTPVQ